MHAESLESFESPEQMTHRSREAVKHPGGTLLGWRQPNILVHVSR